MAELKQRGLRRSIGVPGLFATAYGNVGSSIYYALGLVAAHALGLTPLVFLFAGGLFAMTAKTLGNLYSFGAMLSFTVAHVSIIGLRLRDPTRDRPYRAPWNVRINGKPVPLTAVLGALGTASVFISVAVLHKDARVVGTSWMVAGLGAYLLYRRSEGLNPLRQYRIERPQRPLGFYEVAYHSALVPIFGTDVSTAAMARAAKLVGPDAEVEALYVLTVPRELDLGQGLEEEEQLGRNVLEVARLQARARHLKVRARLIRTRNPGTTIVEEAISRHSDLVYISTEHAPSDERLLGPTTRYVLANRPCRIVIEGGNARPEEAAKLELSAHTAAG